ncbi:MAG: hypothetical protein MUC97_12290 [Bernardetiaceae bacterium]|nr:hypothetical protein [Bernardetiaceae bacterium]
MVSLGIRLCLTISLAGLLMGRAFGQSVQEAKNSYSYGKKLLESGQYAAAKDAFKNAARATTPANPYAAHAAYLQAFAAMQLGKADEAAPVLSQLLAQKPTWDQADEARLLLASAQFELGKPADGAQTLAQVKSPGARTKADALSQAYFLKTSLAQLKALHQSRPGNPVLEEVLYYQLLSQATTEGDKALLKTLQTKLGKASAPTVAVSLLKSEYNIAVVLPFMRSQADPLGSARQYQFAWDLYEGMLMAQRQLAQEGVKINLFAYDSQRDNTKIAELAQTSLPGTDLVIGPVFPNNAFSLSQFAQQRNINLVNPVGNRRELIAQKPHVLLTEPTLETQAQQAARFAQQRFGAGSPAYIYYGEHPDDSLMAHEYRRHLQQNQGRVVAFSKLTSRGNLNQVGNDLRSADQTAHVLVFSNQSNLAVSITGEIIRAKRNLPVLVTKDWLTMEQLNFEQLERSRFHFITPNFVGHSPAREAFDRAFVAQNNVVPSYYAYLGYETLLFFGQMLKRHGTQFTPKMAQEGYVKGRILPGYDYSSGNDNQFLPICQFNQGELEMVNRQ